MNKTTMLTKEQARDQREWYIVDATDKVLGKLANRIAMKLMGKDKPNYTPHVDGGDYVIVINADKFKVTGNKLVDKTYHHYSGFHGGLKERSLERVLSTKPTDPIMLAVKRMLPKNKLATQMLSKLKLFVGTEHPHGAQKPKELDI